MGTPHYMSPEQARGDSRIDERTDIYAVGVILYELLTGAKPHPGANVAAVLFHLLKQEPARIDALRPEVPAALARAVHRAFAFEASDRFRSVDELIDALRPFAAARFARTTPPPAVQGEPDAALSATVPQVAEGSSAARRSLVGSASSGGRAGGLRRRLAGAAVLVVLAAGAAAGFSTRGHDAARPAAPDVGPIDAVEAPPPPRSPPAAVSAPQAATANPVASAAAPANGPQPPVEIVASPASSSRPAKRPNDTRAAPPRPARPDAGGTREDLYEP